tara:strand:+ start:303 stop:557 length:255 start_codon:yes stop_codon:yes gene_type:complete
MKEDKTIHIKPNEVIELEYFNPDIDGLNNIGIKITHDLIRITAYDDQCNEILVKAIPFYELLAIANKNFNDKKQVLKGLFNRVK